MTSKNVDAKAPVCTLVTLAIGLAPLLLGIDALGWGPAANGFSWLLQVDQRKHDYAMSINEPKVLFLGGSNILYGIKGSSMQPRVGRAVVNYGLTIQIGIDLVAERVASVIGPGDVVVLAPEWQHFRSFTAQSKLLDAARSDWLWMHPSNLDLPEQRWPTRQYIRARVRCREMINSALLWWRQTVRPPSDRPAARSRQANRINIYDIANYDARGEMSFPREGTVRALSQWTILPPPRSDDELNFADSRAVVALRLLQEVCDARGAVLCVMPPFRISLPGWDFDVARDIDGQWLDYAREYGALPLVGPGDTMLDSQYAYNGVYHFNEDGVTLMEQRLAQALRQLFASQGPGPTQ